ncbi:MULTISPECIES: SagB/ThcOx family dehydrogenase [Xenorhabdus]|uniref:SagB/ThcOx family dehydrogenase n=1 Tax=Xenorhabdus TaxID=626 RepID=UPI0006461C6A|nr:MULTISPECIES: SagB/ThcOx family dehydrogenase [Xenorhabdus]MBC8946574.1 SagB family dehydrogenase LlsB [Xenorhabdus indica]
MSSQSVDRNDISDDRFPKHSKASLAFHFISSFGHLYEPSSPFEDLIFESKRSNVKTDYSPYDARLSDFSKILRSRQSARKFGQIPLTLHDLLDILWCANGIIHDSPVGLCRTAPSAGGLFPVSSLVLCREVEDLPMAAFTYDPLTTQLIENKEISLPSDFSLLFRTRHIDYSSASAIIMWVGKLLKICPKYGDRGYRYMLLETGHIAQNACLAATKMNVPHIVIGGFDDEFCASTLRLDFPWECVVYAMVLGKKIEG